MCTIIIANPINSVLGIPIQNKHYFVLHSFNIIHLGSVPLIGPCYIIHKRKLVKYVASGAPSKYKGLFSDMMISIILMRRS